MDDAIALEIRGQLSTALEVAQDSDDARAFVTHWGAIAATIPDPEHWVVLSERDMPTRLLLLSGDTIFVVSNSEDRGLIAASRACDIVRVEYWCSRASDGQLRTSWEFGLRESPAPLRIDGRVDQDGNPAGIAERFARLLAGRAGWTGVTPGPAEDAAPGEPHWRERTDVWGRPLDARRR